MFLWAGVALCACTLNRREVGTEGSGVQVYPQLHSESESSLGYKDPVSINQTKTKQQKRYRCDRFHKGTDGGDESADKVLASQV